MTPRSITLPYKDDLVSVEFHRLEEPTTRPYAGPYQGRLELGADEIEFITESEGMALSEVLTTLRSLSTNVGTLERSVERLVDGFAYFKWVIPILIATLLALVALVAFK